MQELLNFFQNALTVWEKIRRFDFRELTFTQIFFAIAGFLVILWLLGLILSFLMKILWIIGPLALVAMGLFAGFRWLRSNSDKIPDVAMKSKKERDVEEALANVQEHIKETGQDVEQVEGRIEVDEAEEVTVEAAKEDNLVVKQVVNPETGFKEPDITRLIEHEEAKLKEADKVNDDIMAQIEARRKRLKNE